MSVFKYLQSPTFLTIIFLKILLAVLFTSEYNQGLFFPFVSSFVSGELNPWQYYLEAGLDLSSFPYHGGMLYLLTPFTYVLYLGGITDYYLVNLFFKIPLYIADVGLFLLLIKLFPLKERKIYIFYFLNPIIIYSSYIHAQLDIIPAFFLLACIYLLLKKNIIFAAVLFGIALSTKSHIALAFPLLILFIFKNYNLRETIKFLLIPFIILVCLDLPFVGSGGFFQMVLFNPKQSLIFDSFYEIGSLKLLLPVFAILATFFHFTIQDKVNSDLLFFYFGILFASTIIFIYPSPSWYVWLIPFVSIFFVRNSSLEKSLTLHTVFSLSYLVFFLFFHKGDYAGIISNGQEIQNYSEHINLANLSFTFLGFLLVAVMYSFYVYGIQSNSIYRRKGNLVIGIGGDSGSGKSFLLETLQDVFGNEMLSLEGDGEHKWERDDKNWDSMSHLNPKANHMHRQASAIDELKMNRTIYRSNYDHDTGKFTDPQKCVPKSIIIISGLHPFYLPKLRRSIDLKIYMNTEESLRKKWKINRDTKHRGYELEKILNQIENRAYDKEKYIAPQRKFADVVIKYFPLKTVDIEKVLDKVDIGLEVSLNANIHIEEVFEVLLEDYEFDYNDDMKTQYIRLHNPPEVDFYGLSKKTISNYSELVPDKAQWGDGYTGFLQFVLLFLISEKLKSVE